MFVEMFNNKSIKYPCFIESLSIKNNVIELDDPYSSFGVFVAIKDSCIICNNKCTNRQPGHIAIFFRTEDEWPYIIKSNYVLIDNNIFDGFSGGYRVSNIHEIKTSNYFAYGNIDKRTWRAIEEIENVDKSEYEFLSNISTDYFDFMNSNKRYNKNLIYYNKDQQKRIKCINHINNVWKEL